MGLCWLLTSPPTFVRMRVSPRAFFIGKSKMKLKSTDETSVEITKDGKICIYQFCKISNQPVEVHLTLEQFDSLETWILRNKDEIECAWNGGVEYDT